MNKLALIVGSTVAFTAGLAQSFAATASGGVVTLDTDDKAAVASAINGLGTSILNFISDVGPYVVTLVAALWIGRMLLNAFKGKM